MAEQEYAASRQRGVQMLAALQGIREKYPFETPAAIEFAALTAAVMCTPWRQEAFTEARQRLRQNTIGVGKLSPDRLLMMAAMLMGADNQAEVLEQALRLYRCWNECGVAGGTLLPVCLWYGLQMEFPDTDRALALAGEITHRHPLPGTGEQAAMGLLLAAAPGEEKQLLEQAEDSYTRWKPLSRSPLTAICAGYMIAARPALAEYNPTGRQDIAGPVYMLAAMGATPQERVKMEQLLVQERSLRGWWNRRRRGAYAAALCAVEGMEQEPAIQTDLAMAMLHLSAMAAPGAIF